MENKKEVKMTARVQELLEKHGIVVPEGYKNPEALILGITFSKLLSHDTLMELAFSRLSREFDFFKNSWQEAIAKDPKALFDWHSFEFTLRSDIIFLFEGNNDEPIPDDKLREIICEQGNALDILAADAQWAVERYTEEVRASVLCKAYNCR